MRRIDGKHRANLTWSWFVRRLVDLSGMEISLYYRRICVIADYTIALTPSSDPPPLI